MTSKFIYNRSNINALEKFISYDRLSTYIKASSDDKEKALKLYLWNSQISSAFYIPLQGLEITLRNNLHMALSKKVGKNDWYDYHTFDKLTEIKIKEAKNKVLKKHSVVNPPHVVAELSFGFWVSLLNRSYHQTLWIPILGKAFPNAKLPANKIRRQLNYLSALRNRIAHHEPIFTRHLEKDYSSTIESIGWMNSEKAKWIDSNNHVIEILTSKPLI